MTPALERAVRELLAREAGEAGSSDEAAAGAAQACDKIIRHLSRIVGEAGVRALFERSLTLTVAKLPWLAAAAAPASDPAWSRLHATLAGQDRDAAREASASLVTAFVELLGRLIGDALVLRLLGEVWSGAGTEAAAETATTPPKEKK